MKVFHGSRVIIWIDRVGVLPTPDEQLLIKNIYKKMGVKVVGFCLGSPIHVETVLPAPEITTDIND